MEPEITYFSNSHSKKSRIIERKSNAKKTLKDSTSQF
jgi:hypothetical protein